MIEYPARQRGFPDVCSPEDSTPQARLAESRPIQIDPRKVCVIEHGALEITPRKISTLQVGAHQIRLVQKTPNTPVGCVELLEI